MANETNISKSDLERAKKYLNSTIFDTSPITAEEVEVKLKPRFEINNRLKNVPLGAEPAGDAEPFVIFKDINGRKLGQDIRVKIRVPPSYFLGKAALLMNAGGVIFPYTPTINFEYKADYATQTPLHSNFAINFYQRSSIGSISIAGKFTVSNKKDADMYLASLHLLRSLTKMKFGGAAGGDPDSGAPPPVCRLDAYGEYMLKNVPVAITNVRVDLPDTVDYFTFKDDVGDTINSVPVSSSLSVTCLPMFSRNEMQKFNVAGYMSSSQFRKQGYM